MFVAAQCLPPSDADIIHAPIRYNCGRVAPQPRARLPRHCATGRVKSATEQERQASRGGLSTVGERELRRRVQGGRNSSYTDLHTCLLNICLQPARMPIRYADRRGSRRMRHWVLSVLMRRLDVSYCGHETGMGYAAFGGRAEMAYPHAIKAPLTKLSFGLPLVPRKRPQRPRAADSQGP